jgi:fumarate reductase (CoM/CoB) subunit B
MIPGIEFIDIEDSDRCCGAGGGVRAGRRELSDDIASIKFDLLSEVQPDVIATSCSFCYIQFLDQIKKTGSKIKVMNVTDLLAMSYRGESLS